LLTLGEPTARQRRDYRALGIGSEHVPDLIRLATDEELRFNVNGEDPAGFGPIHAWWALGQLKSETAIGPLLSILHHIDDDGDDWAGEELPKVFVEIGPVALSALSAYVASPLNKTWAVVAASSALEKIAQRYPETRPGCLAALNHRLEQFAQNDKALNGSLIASLVKLKASESLPLIERAFASDNVDEMVIGDWEDVQIEFGLKEKREHPRKPTRLDELFGPIVQGLARLTGREADEDAADWEPERPIPDHIREWNEQVEAKKRAKAERAPKHRKRRR
jgi:hypothetical protein